MIGLIASGLLRLAPSGLTEQAARMLSKVILIVLAVLAIGAAVWWLRVDAVSEYQVEQERDRAQDAIEAGNRADENAAPREEALKADSKATQDELETIYAEDPEGAVRPASRGNRAVADRLRPR